MDLLSLFVFRPNKLERPSGIPFYAYNVSENTLKRLEDELAQPKCSDSTRVKLLAFVASERFRRNYKDQAWSWADCGSVVARLREKRGNIAFNELMQESLAYWGLKPLVDHGRKLCLASVVTYGGFPVAFLSRQSPLRALLRSLLRKRIASGADELRRAANLLVPASGLPNAFKLSPFFVGLCVDLVDAVANLALKVGETPLHLELLNREQPGWKRTLPLSFDGNDAEHLVAELLNVAADAAGHDGSGFSFIRSIVRVRDSWTPSVQVADLPPRLTLPDECTEPMYRLQVLVEGEVVQELARLVRQNDNRYVAFPRLTRRDLQLDPSFAATSSTLSMQVADERTSISLPSDGGDPLDDDMPWVFASTSEDGAANGGAHGELIGVGSVRTRLPCALVAICDTWEVVNGTWQQVGLMQPNDGNASRQVLLVEGRVLIDAGDAGEFTIGCGATEDSPTLRITGSHVGATSPATRRIFRGEPRVSAVPAAENLTIEWRSVGGGHQRTWSSDLHRARGLVRYRLCDGDASVAEARALVLPEGFTTHSSRTTVDVVLGPGWHVEAPGPVVPYGETWRITRPAGDKSAELELLLGSPYCAKPVVVRVPVFTPGEGFRRLIDRSPAPKRLTVSALSEYVAYSSAPRESLWLTLNGKASFPYRLRAREGSAGCQMPLSLIQNDVREFRYSSDEVDTPLTLSIGQTSLEVAPQRLLRAGRQIRLQEARDLSGELRLRHLSLEHECLLEQSDEQERAWSLPEDFPAGWAIVSAMEVGVRPLAVRFGEEQAPTPGHSEGFRHLVQLDGKNEERVAQLSQHLKEVLDEVSSEASREELEYLRLWLMRFDDLPTDYLDVFKAIASSPSDALRLMAYSYGGPTFDALSAKLRHIPLYWQLASKRSWDGFFPWWSGLLGEEQPGLTQSVVEQLASAQLETMALDAHLAAMYHGFLTQHLMGQVERSPPHRALFTRMVTQCKQTWRNRVASLAEDFHGAAFPWLESVWSVADDLRDTCTLDTGFPGAVSWIEPVLVAPLVAAWVAHDGTPVSDELRRQTAYVRHLGSAEFDTLYAYAAMLLEQIS